MEGFRHEALLYSGEQEFLDGTVRFITDAVAAGDPLLVVVDHPKHELLRSHLGSADGLVLKDMREVGDNPARIIPAWREFVADHAGPGRRLRGIGEPIGPDRGSAELRECHRHEALLNLAFADADDFWLLCPYDTDTLDPAVIEEAHHTHPYVLGGRGHRVSTAWSGPENASLPFAEALPEPAGEPRDLHFDIQTLPLLRRFVARLARNTLFDEDRVTDLQLAVNEVATNSIKHGGGHGVLRIWREPDRLVCEVLDRGTIEDPLAGRTLPDTGATSGHGLWIANQVCDLVQLRSFREGSVVRLHMRA